LIQTKAAALSDVLLLDAGSTYSHSLTHRITLELCYSIASSTVNWCITNSTWSHVLHQLHLYLYIIFITSFYVAITECLLWKGQMNLFYPRGSQRSFSQTRQWYTRLKTKLRHNTKPSHDTFQYYSANLYLRVIMRQGNTDWSFLGFRTCFHCSCEAYWMAANGTMRTNVALFPLHRLKNPSLTKLRLKNRIAPRSEYLLTLDTAITM